MTKKETIPDSYRDQAGQLSYGISNGFFVFFRAGSATNPVAEQVIEDYFFDLFSLDQEFRHTDYQV